MSTDAAARNWDHGFTTTDHMSAALSPFEQLRYAREILQHESRAVAKMAQRLDRQFCQAVECLFQCRGSVIVTGMGKAGLVGQKIMATLASTGTPSHWLHPAEAVHGDLGRLQREDVVLVLSQSGETAEVLRLLPSLAELRVPVVAITASTESTLGRAATVVLALGTLEEACPLGLAPSSSTTVMLALGDALALVTSRMRNFGREDFARYHPAGSLGHKLSKVEQHMRPLAHCRVAAQEATVRTVLVTASVPGRRSGATLLVDAAGRLAGIFTDSDLARLFEKHRDAELDAPIARVMTAAPLQVALGSLLTDAMALMAQRKISELPVVDGAGKPVGMLDITDLVSLMPRTVSDADATAAAPVLPRGPAPESPCRVFPQPDEDLPR
jgi:arabinose-5-phosphate isomerase